MTPSKDPNPPKRFLLFRIMRSARKNWLAIFHGNGFTLLVAG
ncbi:hypothetical protein T458_08275 [Brevibacillus panacihumi W25]|uniref:Uncharacterized protein n=1 Tax=Brevibacillus panacihumi W25 TaxID=1408254 RepID=V6MIJ4_9BACL|nr:hypothetical protein T458_08275 [Brevibacillus panacihumi W25]